MPTYEELFQRGEQLLQHERLEEAVEAFVQAAEAEPQNKAPLSRLGMIFQEAGDLDNAAVCYRAAADLDPDDAFVRLNLGLVRYEQRHLDDAVRELQGSVDLIERGIRDARGLLEERPVAQAESIREQCAALEKTGLDVRMLLLQIMLEQTAAADGLDGAEAPSAADAEGGSPEVLR